MPKHGSVNFYVHGNQKARWGGQPRTATSTLTLLMNYETLAKQLDGVYIQACGACFGQHDERIKLKAGGS